MDEGPARLCGPASVGLPRLSMRGGNVAISNCGKDGLGRKGRIDDQAARETWAAMARVALKGMQEAQRGNHVRQTERK